MSKEDKKKLFELSEANKRQMAWEAFLALLPTFDETQSSYPVLVKSAYDAAKAFDEEYEDLIAGKHWSEPID